MSDLPAPPVPSDCDLIGMWFPLRCDICFCNSWKGKRVVSTDHIRARMAP